MYLLPHDGFVFVCFLVWDQTKFSRFRWVWQDVTTFALYLAETSYENSLLVQQSGGLALRSLAHVMRSLTPNARKIFELLAQYQLDNADNSSFVGESSSKFCRWRNLLVRACPIFFSWCFFFCPLFIFILFVHPDVTVLVDSIKHQFAYLLLLFVLSLRREAENILLSGISVCHFTPFSYLLSFFFFFLSFFT